LATVIDRESIMHRPKQKHWISYIKQRIYAKNKNFMCIITGETGSGKSWSAISIGEEIDQEFGINRIVFSFKELMDLINGGSLKRGSAIVFEEAGVGMSRKEWASVRNKLFSFLAQTFRHKGYIFIVNSPSKDYVDNAMLKLFHAEFKTAGIDQKKCENRLKPYLLQWRSDKNKFYNHWLKVRSVFGKAPVQIWRVHKPSQVIIDLYEEKKTEFTSKLNKMISNEVTQLDNEDEEQFGGNLSMAQQELVDLLVAGKDLDYIVKIKGSTKNIIKHDMSRVYNKGYRFNLIEDEISLTGKQRYVVIPPRGVVLRSTSNRDNNSHRNNVNYQATETPKTSLKQQKEDKNG